MSTFSDKSVVKRQINTGCPELNGTIYTSTVTSFKVYCGIDWLGNDLTNVYTLSLPPCMDQCVTFNTWQYQGPKCVGVSWVPGRYGTGGSAAGSACYFKWIMPGAGQIQSFEVDSAQIVSNGNSAITSSNFATVTFSSTKSANEWSASATPTTSAPVPNQTIIVNDGVSGSAIGGIVGGVLGGMIVSAIMVYLYLRRKRSGGEVVTTQTEMNVITASNVTAVSIGARLYRPASELHKE